MNFVQNFSQTILKLPAWIVFLKFPHIADPPDVIPDAVRLLVSPSQLASADFFTQIDCFEHRTVTMPTAADVINFAGAWRANEFRKCFDQIEAVNVVTHLLPFVSEDAIQPVFYCAEHQVRKKPMQLCAGMRRPS